MVSREEVVERLQKCTDVEGDTLFVIFKSMNSNCVIYKSKSEEGQLVGVAVEWLM
jgi:hypothetical protein